MSLWVGGEGQGCTNQRQIFRDRRRGTTACLTCRAKGTNEVKDKSLLYWHDKPNEQPGTDPFHGYCTHWIPIGLSFSRQQGSPISSLSGILTFWNCSSAFFRSFATASLNASSAFSLPSANLQYQRECKWERVGPWNGSERSECHLAQKKSICFLTYSLM